MGNLKYLLLAGVLGGMTAFTFLTGIFLYKQPLTLKIVKVNLQHLLKEEAQKLSHQGLSPDEESKALKHSFSHLNTALQSFPSNVVLLDASAVLSSQVPDYTSLVREKLQEERQK